MSLADGITSIATAMLQWSESVLGWRGSHRQMRSLGMKAATIGGIRNRVYLAIVAGVRVGATDQDFTIGPRSLVGAALVPFYAISGLKTAKSI